MTVLVSTLRSWERCYDLPTTARTIGGHRRYTMVAIDELRLMRDEIARGKRGRGRRSQRAAPATAC